MLCKLIYLFTLTKMISQTLKVRTILPIRTLGLYEYEAMDLLEKNNIAVPKRSVLKNSTSFSATYEYDQYG